MRHRGFILSTATFLSVIVAGANLLGAATNYVTTTDDSGPGSLRQAILAANAGGGGAIRFSNVAGTITLQSELPAVSANVSIRGPGRELLSISGNNGHRAFIFNAGTTNELSGLTIRHCLAGNGGGVCNFGQLKISRCLLVWNAATNGEGGAVFSSGPLHVAASILASNSVVANVTSGLFGGGALCLRNASGVIEDCSFSANRSATSLHVVAAGGGILLASGSFLPNDSLRILRCSFDGNSAEAGFLSSAAGGAIYAEGSNLIIGDSTLSSNVATATDRVFTDEGFGAGGAIYRQVGSLTISNCVLALNQSRGARGNSYSPFPFGTPADPGGPGFGGAVALVDASMILLNSAIIRNTSLGGRGGEDAVNGLAAAGGLAMGGGLYGRRSDIRMSNSTISENSVTGGGSGGGSASGGAALGGGISMDGGTILITNATLAMNQAAAAFGTTNAGGGIYLSGAAAVMRNTILADNVASAGPDGLGAIGSRGYNMITMASGLSGFTASDRVGLQARLGPLQDNGGSTWSHALLAGSPAIDGGASSGTATDQRGQPRPVDMASVSNAAGGDGTDIGALEVDDRLRVTGAGRWMSNFVVNFTSVSDKRYGLEHKSALNENWTPLPGQIPGSGGIVRATNEILPNSGMRFYRVQENPP